MYRSIFHYYWQTILTFSTYIQLDESTHPKKLKLNTFNHHPHATRSCETAQKKRREKKERFILLCKAKGVALNKYDFFIMPSMENFHKMSKIKSIFAANGYNSNGLNFVGCKIYIVNIYHWLTALFGFFSLSNSLEIDNPCCTCLIKIGTGNLFRQYETVR